MRDAIFALPFDDSSLPSFTETIVLDPSAIAQYFSLVNVSYVEGHFACLKTSCVWFGRIMFIHLTRLCPKRSGRSLECLFDGS